MDPTGVGDGMAAMDALWHGVASGRPYAVVLLDSRMPDTDGFTLTTKIRERAELSASRVILLTSGDRPGDVARYRELRVDAHLLKPVPQGELLETIHAVMSRVGGDAPAVAWPSAPPPPATEPAVNGPSFSVLVVEDNELNSQLFKELLVRRGHRVQIASNGREALDLLTRNQFDLMLLDLHMPDMNGFQVIRAVRAGERSTGGHLPAIALTAQSRPEDRERVLAAGMDDFLSKPIKAADLWAAIARVMAAARPEDRTARGLIDPLALQAASGGDPAILARICAVFQARLPPDLAEIEQAFQQADARRLREAAHKLAAMLGAFSTVAGRVASELEDCAARGDLIAAGPLVAELGRMAAELIDEVGRLSRVPRPGFSGSAD
jgi:CheY-like chemotaxis protein/HPt (histidine-containing phosphotransfer) domain-containing protein